MFWKSSKPKKEPNSNALLHQDGSTSVKSSSAQSETTRVSVQSASSSIVKNSQKTVAYKTTTHTQVTRQQQANYTNTKTITIGGSSISEKNKTTVSKASSLASLENIKSTNNSVLSPASFIFKYDDSPRSRQTTTTITTTSARVPNASSSMSNLQTQRMKFDAKPFKLSSPNSPLTIQATPSNLYQSPYLNRSIFTPTEAPTRTFTTSTAATPLKPTVVTKSNWLKGNTTTTPANSLSSVKTGVTTNRVATKPAPALASTRTTAFKPSIINNADRNKSKLQPGYLYIFNNESFDNPNNEYRVGSSEDVKCLKTTFEKLKLKVHLIENASLNVIDSTVKKIATKDFGKNSCLVIAILSHGARYDQVCAKDGTYNVDDKILFPILGNRSLIDKPKILFIQACKGDMEIGGFYRDAAQPHGSPNEIFKCYSTFEGYVSYRSDKGSIFIQTLCELLQINGGNMSIQEILEKVKLRVKEKSNSKQIPAILSSLTQPYIFGDYV